MILTPLKSKTRFFKLPDSLFGQLFYILLFGIIILQATNFEVVCSVQRLYVRQAEKIRAEQLVTYWFLFNSMTPDQRKAAIKQMSDTNRPEKKRQVLELLPDKPDWKNENNDDTQILYQMVRASFATDKSPAIVARTLDDEKGLFPIHLPVLETAIRLSDGIWLQVIDPFNVDDRHVVWTQRFFVLIEGAVMLLLTTMLLSRVTKPIRQLSEAAESFGKYPELSKPLPEKGVKELRHAAQSFNHMRERICGNLAERDRMIAAMAHDLRTPLTKLQLRLDKVEQENLRTKLLETVSDIKAIICQGLELAKSLNTDEAMTKVDMKAFLQSLADDYADVGQNVCMTDSEKSDDHAIIVECRPLCLKRCLENLVSNACKYGGCAEISLLEKDEHIIINIIDKGAGIPEEMLERVFEPYFRLEASRNRSSGGTGLGLTIARNMALLNNGDVKLYNCPDVGLVAQVILPSNR